MGPAGPILLALREAVRKGRVHLQPEVQKRQWRLVARGHDLVRSQGNSKVPAATHRLESWSGARRARFKPRARRTRGLKTKTGILHCVCLKRRTAPAGTENMPMTARNQYQRD